MSSWLDLINLGLNAAQSYQLGKARSSLQQIESGTMAEAQRQAVLEVLRSFIFDLAQDVKALDQHIEAAPQQVYVVARALDWRLKDSGITPDVFREFVDKEYLAQTQAKIDESSRQARQRLGPGELQDVEIAVSDVIQSNLLSKAIEAKSAQEELRATETTFTELSRHAASAGNHKTMGCAGIVGALVVLPIVMFSCSLSADNGSGFILVLGSLAGIALLVWSIGQLAHAKPGEYESLKEKREALKAKLLPTEVWQQVVDLWGDQPSQRYRAIQAEREGHLRSIFSQVEGFDKFLPSAN